MKNTKHRTNAKNEFEKDLFKLMNNSVFGKTMENIRELKDIKLVNSIKDLNKYVREPNMKNIKYFSDSLLAIEMRKTEITMNKPVYIGQAILDISKTLMYEFYYEYIKPKYENKVKLCYTDTDSFIMQIFTDDFFADISFDANRWFDTSCYSKESNNPLEVGVNEKVPGMMKDETYHDEMIESDNVCVYSHVRQINKGSYNGISYNGISYEEKKKAKGIKKCVKEQCMKF